jgi:aminoglycoside/choline kinase family phosphotransferase
MNGNPKTEILKEMVHGITGAVPSECIPIFSGSASPRQYFRLYAESGTFIGTISNHQKENEAFFYLTDYFRQHGLPVPAILAARPDAGAYIQEDLGDLTLNALLTEDLNGNIELVERALEWLIRFQVSGTFGLDYGKCYPNPLFDKQTALWDLHYFKYMFLKLAGIDYDDNTIEQEFNHLLDSIFEDCVTGFMYRDFQSRNIMVRHNMLWFIDYQGGRRGPLPYDAASLLYQSRIDLSDQERERLTALYSSMLQEYFPLQTDVFSLQVKGFAVLRLLQTLGAYGFRGLFEGKEAFRKPIVPAIRNVLHVIGQTTRFLKLEYLTQLLNKASERFPETEVVTRDFTLTINSFSYMQGVPKDFTGNGGGFVFDCRALPNPHRDETLRPLNGKDQPIREWLGKKEEVARFLEHCEALVLASADLYISRGFTNLQVNFGCTGGKHRSVFCAEVMAKRIQSSGRRLSVKVIHTNIE